MVKLTERQEQIVTYFRENGVLHKGRYAVKSAIAYKCAQFFELTVLQNIGTITYSPEQKCYYINAAPQTPPREKWHTEGIADYMPDVESEVKHGHWQGSNAAPPAASAEMFAVKRFGGTKPITAEQERTARTRYFDARQVADELRASARTQALTMAPHRLKELQGSVERFYEAVEIEARRARELFDLLADQTYD